MINKIIIILLVLIFLPASALGEEPGSVPPKKPALLVMDGWNNVFEETLRGIKDIYRYDLITLDVGGLKGAAAREKVREIDPGLIWAMGGRANEKLKEIKDTPIILVQTPEYKVDPYIEKNVTGVRVYIPLAVQLATLKTAMPGVKTIAFLYTKDAMRLAKEAKDAAESHGMRAMPVFVESKGDVPALLEKIGRNAQVYWMIPDYSLCDFRMLNRILYFSIKSHIPVLTFAKMYVPKGAVFASSPLPIDIGRQAGKIALAIAGGARVENMAPVYPEEEYVSFNNSVAKMFLLTIDDAFLPRIDFYQ